MEITHTRARALIRGAGAWAGVKGLATFRQCHRGVLVTVEVEGLPQYQGERWFLVNIRRGQRCSQPLLPEASEFPGRPQQEKTPGQTLRREFPLLLDCGGVAFSSFLTDAFRVEQIIGRRLVVQTRREEDSPGPEAQAGELLACGEIVAGC